MGLQREVKQRGAQVPKGGREKGLTTWFARNLDTIRDLGCAGHEQRIHKEGAIFRFFQSDAFGACVCARARVCVCVHSERKQKVCLDVERFRVNLVEQMTTCKPIRALSLCSNLKLQQTPCVQVINQL